MRERKAVSSDAAELDLEVYGRGVEMMRQRSTTNPMDPLGWEYQSRMHGNPGGTPRSPGEPRDWSECQHGTWFFLPWHRMYLLQFERIIQSGTGADDFALPYWDYASYEDVTIPEAFLDRASPLFNPKRELRPPPSDFGPATWHHQTSFVRFGGGISETPNHTGAEPGALELNPHNPVHGRIRGDMATFQSPLDPLFWIHHCNIDRLWAVWLGLADRANPAERAWIETSWDFPDPGPTGRRRWRVADVRTTADAGYTYADVSAPLVIDAAFRILADVPVEPSRRDDELELVAATSTGGSVADSFALELPLAVRRRSVVAGVAAEGDAATREPLPLFLRLENVGIKAGDASSMWNVYVGAGTGEPHVAGTIAPFGLAGLTARGGRQTITMDITHLSGELVASDGPITVTFAPVYDDVVEEPFFERAALYTTPA